MPEALRLELSSYDHPDAVAMTASVQEYYRQVYGGTDDDPLSPADLSPPQGAFLIGYLSDAAVAMGGWLRYSGTLPVPAACPVQLRRMFVRGELRRRGLGRALLLGLEQSAAHAGADLVVLATGRPQADAIALYRANGYTDIPGFGYYADSPLAVHLAKRLRSSPAG